MTVGRRATLSLAALLALLALEATPGAALAKPRVKQIHGTYRFRGSLLMRRGEIFLVTKTVRIVAGGNITVDGPIELAPGAGLTLDAGGRLRINAPVRPAPAGTRRAASARGGTCANPPILERSETFGVDVNASEYANSGSTDAEGDGCNGQSIVISATFGGIDINAAVVAGAGGHGRDNAKLELGRPGGCHGAGQNTVVRGGNGGDGGNVTITGHPKAITGGAVIGAQHVRAGDGGIGGSVTATSPNGGGYQSGAPLAASSGRGGDGGDARLDYGDSHVTFGHAGGGGFPGSVNVFGGNGGAPGCDGGGFFVTVGRAGEVGHGSFRLPRAPRDAHVSIEGGNASETPPFSGDGGRGGELTLHGGSERRHGRGRTTFLESLSIFRFGNAGPGSNGCPTRPGGGGGRDGDFTTSIAKPLDGRIHVAPGSRNDVAYSFNGGAGGDGTPPGRGWQPIRPLAADGLQLKDSWQKGADGKPCPLPRVSYSDHPFNDIQSWVAGGSTVDPAEPNDVFALGQTSGGVYKIVDFSTTLNGPNPAFGGGTGEIALPAPPNVNGYSGISRPAPGYVGAWAPSGMMHLVYSRFTDAGMALGATNVSTGTALFSTPQIFDFRTGAGSLFVVSTDVDSVSHNPGLASFAVSATGVVSAGPCPTPTIFPHTNPTLSSVAYDPASSRFYFAGAVNMFADTGFFSTDGSCANATSPVSLGLNAGQTLPVVSAAGDGDAFVLAGVPAPNNDQKLALYKVDANGAAVPGFATWFSSPGLQAFPNSLFLDGGDVTALGDLSALMLYVVVNENTGALDRGLSVNPLQTTTPGATFSIMQSAQQPAPGTFVIFSDDSGQQGGVTVLNR